jgi:Spy/CpxP family protein refolding chaperone
MKILAGSMIALMLIGAGAAVTLAQPAPDLVEAGDPGDFYAQAPAPPAAPPGVPDLQRRLGLTEEQARRVQQILSAHRERTARLRIDLARARLDGREVMLSPTPDRARIDAVARRIGELQGQLAAARMILEADLKQVLTPEQLTRLRASMMWTRPGMRERRR